MPDHEYIVLSKPPEGVSAEDSDAIREAQHQELHDAGAVDGMKCDELLERVHQ